MRSHCRGSRRDPERRCHFLRCQVGEPTKRHDLLVSRAQLRNRRPEFVIAIGLARLVRCIDEPTVTGGHGRLASAPASSTSLLIDQLVPCQAKDPRSKRDAATADVADLPPRLLERHGHHVVGHPDHARAPLDKPDQVGCMAAEQNAERRVVTGASRCDQDRVVPVGIDHSVLHPPLHSARSVPLARGCVAT